MVSQSEARLERFSRHEANNWLYTDVTGLEATLNLASLALELALAAVYRNIDFENDEIE